MIDDFYEILNVKPNASVYKIALQYKILAKKQILFEEQSKSDFYKINSAFEVLTKKNVRKYYDILYRIFVRNEPINIRSQIIEKYLLIVNNQIFKGIEKADKIINNESLRLVKNIKRPLVLSFLIGAVTLYVRYPVSLERYSVFLTSPLAGFCLLIIGGIVFFSDILGISSDLWFSGLISFLGGIISIYANFRCFTIDLMNDER